MVRLLSLVFLLHLRLPHSTPYSHLWLSKEISISTLQCKLKRKKCLPWIETLTWMLFWAFPFPHCHLLHHPLHQSSVNSEEISNPGVKGIMDNIDLLFWICGLSWVSPPHPRHLSSLRHVSSWVSPHRLHRHLEVCVLSRECPHPRRDHHPKLDELSPDLRAEGLRTHQAHPLWRKTSSCCL